MYKVVCPTEGGLVVFTGSFEACQAEAKRLSQGRPRLYLIYPV